MKITARHYDTTITIENDHDDLDLNQVMDGMIRPLLLALAYPAKSIEEWFEEGDYEGNYEEG